MNCERARELLDRWPAGPIPAGEAEAFDQHLAGCAACREDRAAATAVAPAVAALPERIEPPRDLWPDVRRRIGRPLRRTPRWRTMGLAAAAAIALVAGSSAVTLHFARGRPGVATAPRIPAIEAGYASATADLLRALDAQRSHLSPATIATLERNLAVIDAAIAESRAALASDPGNRDLEALLLAGYRQKVALLQQATRLAERS